MTGGGVPGWVWAVAFTVPFGAFLGARWMLRRVERRLRERGLM